MHALFKIAISDSTTNITPQLVKEHLLLSKAAYMRAFKAIDLEHLDDLAIQILNNLGNEFDCVGRVVEALQLYDMVLEYAPDFPYALMSKANCMEYMMHIADGPQSVSFYAELYSLYGKVLRTEKLADVVQRARAGLSRSKAMLDYYEFDLADLPKELQTDEEEYQSHTMYRKFCLDNFLSLSEHGLFCKCHGATLDNLSIGHHGFVTSDVKIMKLEILLNRLKSEFSLARRMYYHFIEEIDLEDDVFYEEMFIGEKASIRIEKLRAGFRMCFGILDKIAKGICYTFNLPVAERESIYFESFWNSKSSKESWATINSFNNIHLTALYSMATDLNVVSGELGVYKEWRNLLEHNIFIVSESSDDKFGLYAEKDFLNSIDLKTFSAKTKHLLQITRAAIFSYTFCVRYEIMELDPDNSQVR